MDRDTMTRLINLGIVEESDGGTMTLSSRYLTYLDEVSSILLNSGYDDGDDPYSLMLDINAYAIASWVGVIRESELAEMLAAVMSIWGEILW